MVPAPASVDGGTAEATDITSSLSLDGPPWSSSSSPYPGDALTPPGRPPPGVVYPLAAADPIRVALREKFPRDPSGKVTVWMRVAETAVVGLLEAAVAKGTGR